MSKNKQRVLYISYDGVLEPLGSSQIVSYLLRLSVDTTFHLLTFEKRSDSSQSTAVLELKTRLQQSGIVWHKKTYHKAPAILATSYDILIGFISGLWIIHRHKIEIIHCRSYVPSVIALALLFFTRVKFLFDMRGFWADERIDAGQWPRDGRLYLLAKWFEKKFLLAADHVVSLTHAGVIEIQKFKFFTKRQQPPITVIPTCADLIRFAPTSLPRSGFTLGYVGSAGLWYEFDAAVNVFNDLLSRRSDSKILIINRDEHSFIRSKLERARVNPERVTLMSALPNDMPVLINQMHAGVFFIKPSFSKKASAPTKLGEFLGCGIPCLSNTGIGDMTNILVREKVGVAISNFSPQSLQKGLDKLLVLVNDRKVNERCRRTAEHYFSVDEGANQYKNVYKGMVSPR